MSSLVLVCMLAGCVVQAFMFLTVIRVTFLQLAVRGALWPFGSSVGAFGVPKKIDQRDVFDFAW